MKKITTLFAVGAIILIASTGCIKNTKPTVYQPPTDEFFSYTANGVDYYYQQYDLLASWSGRRAIELGSSVSQGGYYSLIAQKPTDPMSLFYFKIGPKTYFETSDTFPIENIEVSIKDFINYSNNFQNVKSGGQIIIIERNTDYIKGNFQFIAYNNDNSDSLIVSNGKFKVNFKK